MANANPNPNPNQFLQEPNVRVPRGPPHIPILPSEYNDTGAGNRCLINVENYTGPRSIRLRITRYVMADPDSGQTRLLHYSDWYGYEQVRMYTGPIEVDVVVNDYNRRDASEYHHFWHFDVPYRQGQQGWTPEVHRMVNVPYVWPLNDDNE